MSTLKVNNVEDLGADPVVTNGVLVKSAFPAGTILQVVSTAKTDVFSTASATFTTVTGLTASITPSTSTSKILIFAQIAYSGQSAQSVGHFKVTRGGTDIYVGDSGSSRVQAVFGGYNQADNGAAVYSGSIMYLDSPATTSSTTYQVEVRRGLGGTVFVNRAVGAGSDANHVNGASSITVMEVAG